MMKCKNKRASTKETHGETRNSWKSSGASVSGRYNLPLNIYDNCPYLISVVDLCEIYLILYGPKLIFLMSCYWYVVLLPSQNKSSHGEHM